ncbi:MAG: fatty acid desaturase [Gammaproteobacteria bacterium]|jgi:fatty acid desaturase
MSPSGASNHARLKTLPRSSSRGCLVSTNHGALDEHCVHHSAPRVPIYSLGAVQREISDKYAIRAYDFSVSNVLKVLQHCKLYDYENHLWLDFDGRQSTPVDLGLSARGLQPIDLVG